MKFGYIRVSTEEQNEERQINELLKHEVDRRNIFLDKISGTVEEKKNYILLKYKLREGDELYVHELDRLGRNKKEVKEQLENLKREGILVRILDIPTTLMDFSEFGELQKSIMEMVNTILIEVLSTQAEAELAKIKKRQSEGIAVAKKRGKYRGGKKKELPSNFGKLYGRWKNKEIKATEFCQLAGYKSRTSLYQKIKQYEEEQNLERSFPEALKENVEKKEGGN